MKHESEGLVNLVEKSNLELEAAKKLSEVRGFRFQTDVLRIVSVKFFEITQELTAVNKQLKDSLDELTAKLEPSRSNSEELEKLKQELEAEKQKTNVCYVNF